MAVSVWNKPCTIINIYWRIVFVSGDDYAYMSTVHCWATCSCNAHAIGNDRCAVRYLHSVHKGSLSLYWWNYQGEEGAFLSSMSYCNAHTRLCVTSISSQNQRDMWKDITSC